MGGSHLSVALVVRVTLATDSIITPIPTWFPGVTGGAL